MRIFVTGAGGFLGTALCRRLHARGDSVTAPSSRECDLRGRESLEAFNKPEYDLIYHLAAWTQAGDFCLRHPGEQWVINQQMNTHVLDWWQRRQPQAKLITMGTSCSYDPQLPLVEENYLAGTPIDSLFTYAHTKRMLYIGQLALRKQFGLRFATFVPSTLYGPGYHTDGRQMHFIFDLIRKILRGKLYGEPVVLWGNGHQKRELIHRDDFVDMMIDLAPGLDDGLLNIGAGEEFSIRHFAQMICDQTGYDFSAITFDTSRYVGATSKCLDIARLRRLRPHLHITPLADGLRQTIEWFSAHQDRLLAPAGGGA